MKNKILCSLLALSARVITISESCPRKRSNSNFTIINFSEDNAAFTKVLLRFLFPSSSREKERKCLAWALKQTMYGGSMFFQYIVKVVSKLCIT